MAATNWWCSICWLPKPDLFWTHHRCAVTDLAVNHIATPLQPLEAAECNTGAHTDMRKGMVTMASLIGGEVNASLVGLSDLQKHELEASAVAPEAGVKC